MRRRRKQLSLTKISIIFVVCTLTFSVGYSLLSQQLSVEGTANLLYEEEIVCKEYVTDDLKITYDNKALWHNGGLNYMQIDVTLTNLKQEEINDWKVMLKFISDVEISGSWAGNYELSDRKITITGMDWNKNISVGGQITFGFQVSTPDEEIKLSSIYLNGNLAVPSETCGTSSISLTSDSGNKKAISDDENKTDDVNDEKTNNQENISDNIVDDLNNSITSNEEIKEDITNNVEDSKKDLLVQFTKGDSWESEGLYYIQYNVKVTNNSDINLNEWSYQFELPKGARITQNWNCNYVNADGLVTISSTESNSNLLSLASTEMGFQILSPILDFNLEKK